ncbi:MAG: CerR family C-terminal domain-containing protein [Burkholderiales bacterium]|nr:CerR family C-terminal domain-containing protein [Burkholderiales bacterium]
MPSAEKVQDDTRRRLIQAAVSVFGSQGFEGASTRRIAALAGTNISSIAYHFGGKENLYLAAADSIAQEIGKKVDEVEDFLAEGRERIRRGTLPPEEAVALLQRLCGAWLDALLVKKKHDHEWAWFVVREKANPTAAFDRIYDASFSRFLDLLAELIGCIRQLPPRSPAVRLQAVLLFGKMLSFERERATITRYMGWKTLDETARDAVLAAIHKEVAYLLKGGENSPLK